MNHDLKACKSVPFSDEDDEYKRGNRRTSCYPTLKQARKVTLVIQDHFHALLFKNSLLRNVSSSFILGFIIELDFLWF